MSVGLLVGSLVGWFVGVEKITNLETAVTALANQLGYNVSENGDALR